MQRATLTLLCALAVASCGTGADLAVRKPLSLPQAIDAVRPAIVQIVFGARTISEVERAKRKIKDDLHRRVAGTGFMVNEDGYVVTARHVIVGSRVALKEMSLFAENLYFVLGLAYESSEYFRGNFYLQEFDVVGEDLAHDLALLKMKQKPRDIPSLVAVKEKRLAPLYGAVKFDSSRPKDGAAIAISGYPLQQPVLNTNSGSIAAGWARSNVAEPKSGKVLTIEDSYRADVIVNPGNSGGPAYLVDSAAVIGVCVAARGGISIIVPSKYVIDLLKKHSVAWTDISQ